METIPKEFQLASDFPKIGYATWRNQVEAELKGAPFDKRMVTHTYEGINLQPLYTEDIFPTATDPAGLPGYLPFIRGTEALANSETGWDIRQEHAHPDPEVANAQILEDLNAGVTSIEVRLDGAGMQGLDADDRRAADLTGRDGVSLSSVDDIERLARGVKLDVAGLHLNAGASFLPASSLYVVAAKRAGIPVSALLGSFNADPLRVLARDGNLPMPLETALQQMADLAAWTAQNAPHMTAIEVASTPYHDAGASAVADIAFAVATGLDYLRVLTNAGLDLETSARQITFSMGLGCRFYLAIAKIRAARKLWADVIEGCGGGADAQKLRLHVSTGRRVLTTRNQLLNILRNTVACYAGAVAGADAITMLAFDVPTGLPSESSRHNARNTQHILAEECHLAKIVDPTSGSWFIECYTNEVAKRAWGVFQQVEAQGGMIKALTSGWVAEQIQPTEAARERDIAVRRVAVIGVSEHPTLDEDRPEQEKPNYSELAMSAAQRLSNWRRQHGRSAALDGLTGIASGSGRLTAAAVAAAEAGATLGQIAEKLMPSGAQPTVLTPLAVHPYDAAFEDLRDAAEVFESTHGHRPRVFLAGVGTIAEQNARKNYATNFFEAGGFEVVSRDTQANIDQAAAAFAASGAKVAVICSTDKQYATVVQQLAPKLKAAGARTVILAGNPGQSEATYRAAGVDRFIYVRCDVLNTLWSLLHEEETQS
ncbi:MAG: acyl-CoA mutase large subunit family protein [Acetobacteraceae bacterium]|nr:acyl-CoA mutase large subunit family protein [Acetobacteraceae bacterium]